MPPAQHRRAGACSCWSRPSRRTRSTSATAGSGSARRRRSPSRPRCCRRAGLKLPDRAPGRPGGAADSRAGRRRCRSGAPRARSAGGRQEARPARGRRGRPAVRTARSSTATAAGTVTPASTMKMLTTTAALRRARPAAPVHHEGGGHPAVEADRAGRRRRPAAREEARRRRRLPGERGPRHPARSTAKALQAARPEPGHPRLRRLAVHRARGEPEVGADVRPRGRGQPDLGAVGRRGSRAAGPRLPHPRPLRARRHRRSPTRWPGTTSRCRGTPVSRPGAERCPGPSPGCAAPRWPRSCSTPSSSATTRRPRCCPGRPPSRRTGRPPSAAAHERSARCCEAGRRHGRRPDLRRQRAVPRRPAHRRQTLLSVLRVASGPGHRELRPAVASLPVAGFTGSLRNRFATGERPGSRHRPRQDRHPHRRARPDRHRDLTATAR